MCDIGKPVRVMKLSRRQAVRAYRQRENAALRRLADEARAHAEAVDHDAALQHDRAERMREALRDEHASRSGLLHRPPVPHDACSTCALLADLTGRRDWRMSTELVAALKAAREWIANATGAVVLAGREPPTAVLAQIDRALERRATFREVGEEEARER